MLQKTAILTLTFLLACACAYAQTETYYDDPYYQSEAETHIVKRGETLYAISKKYGMTVNDIMRVNQLRSSTIKIGQRLEVESSSSNRRVASSSQNDSRGMDSGDLKVNGPRTYYKVQRGDNIYSIASQFGVLVDEIREWNALSSISVGQTLIVGQNDIARIPSYRPAPQENAREDESIYRRLNSRTSSRSLNQDRSVRNTQRFDREEERPSISSYRKRAQEDEARERYDDREYNRYDDRYDSRYDDRNERETDTYIRSNADRYRREQESRNANSSDRFNNNQVDDRRFFSSDNARRTQSSYDDAYDDYREENSNSRMPRAADINSGSRSGLLYNYVGDGIGEPQKATPDRYESQINARTLNPREDAFNSRTINPSSLTGDFTELKSKKATNNRFYAFHNSLPIGSKVKMKIPKNEGYVEVEIIDRLPSYERVMIGLSPACTAILEGAGNPHTVTITAN